MVERSTREPGGVLKMAPRYFGAPDGAGDEPEPLRDHDNVTQEAATAFFFGSPKDFAGGATLVPDTDRPLLDLRPNDPARIGRYELLRRIPGDHATDVFVVRDDSKRLLVLKLSGDNELADPQRINLEAANLRRVDSTRVAKVLDSGVWEERAYFVQEFIDGPTLADRLQGVKDRTASLPDTYRIASQLAQALQAVDAAGVVHRDVKPSNIILSDSRGVVLVDFGIARTLRDPRLTMHGATLGTPRYMSPEQAAGGEVRSASDVFQWGLVVGEALLGRHPILGVDTDGLRAVLLCVPDPAIGSSGGRLDRLVRQALHHDPNSRPTFGQILAELDQTEAWQEPGATEVVALPDRRVSDPRTLDQVQGYVARRTDQVLGTLADELGLFLAALLASMGFGLLLGFLVAVAVSMSGGGA